MTIDRLERIACLFYMFWHLFFVWLRRNLHISRETAWQSTSCPLITVFDNVSEMISASSCRKFFYSSFTSTVLPEDSTWEPKDSYGSIIFARSCNNGAILLSTGLKADNPSASGMPQKDHVRQNALYDCLNWLFISLNPKLSSS